MLLSLLEQSRKKKHFINNVWPFAAQLGIRALGSGVSGSMCRADCTLTSITPIGLRAACGTWNWCGSIWACFGQFPQFGLMLFPLDHLTLPGMLVWFKSCNRWRHCALVCTWISAVSTETRLWFCTSFSESSFLCVFKIWAGSLSKNRTFCQWWWKEHCPLGGWDTQSSIIICILQPISLLEMPINVRTDRRICLTSDRLKLCVLYFKWLAGRSSEGSFRQQKMNYWRCRWSYFLQECGSALHVSVCIYSRCIYWPNFSISSDVIYIPSASRALRSLVITLLCALSISATPIYNITPVPCFSEGETEISVEMSVFTLWLDVKFIELSGLYLFHFNGLIRTEDSHRKLLSWMLKRRSLLIWMRQAQIRFAVNLYDK